MTIHAIQSEAGRSLEVATLGSPSTEAVIFHHGTPGSYKSGLGLHLYAQTQGAFVISFSRAGYGESDRNKSRAVIENVKDVQIILEHFGIKKFVSIGQSGGGPYCLADTSLSQNRGAVNVAGVGAYGVDELNFFEGMGEGGRDEYRAAIAGEESLENWMKERSAGAANITGPHIIEVLGGSLGVADKIALDFETAEYMAAGARHALSSGYYGWMDDDLALVKPWEFDLSAISKPVELWTGGDDLVVPSSHGEWLHGKIAHSKMFFVPGEGHMSLAKNKREEIISHALAYLN